MKYIEEYCHALEETHVFGDIRQNVACSCGQEDVQDKKLSRAKTVVDVIDNVHVLIEKQLHIGVDNYVV